MNVPLGRIPLLDEEGLKAHIEQAKLTTAETTEYLNALNAEKRKREKAQLNRPVFSLNRIDLFIEEVKARRKIHEDKLYTISGYGGPEPGSMSPSEHHEKTIKEIDVVLKLLDKIRSEAYVNGGVAEPGL